MNGLILFSVLIAVARAAINNPSCGRRPLAPTTTDKVVGGQAAIVGDWPWMCAMRRNGNFICGGSAIEDSWLLTAAHCVFGSTNPAVYMIDCFHHDRLNMEVWGVTLRVQSVILHESYSASTLRHDIALLKFTTSISWQDPYAIPVCVPDGSEDWQNEYCVATGWGTLFSGGSVSRYLMEVEMLYLNDTRCKQRFGASVDTTMQCCGGEVGEGFDTCQGDSGGPYVCKSKSSGRWNLAGLTSWGYGCGDGGVYTKTSYYYNWIQSKVSTS